MSDRHGPRPLPDGFIGEYFRGLGYPMEALRFIQRNDLWGMTIVSIIVNVVLLTALLGVSFYFLFPALDDLEVWLGTLFDSDFGKSVATVIAWVVRILAVPLAFIANLLVLMLVGQAVATPFLDSLSEKVETIVMGTEPARFSLGRTARTLLLAASDLVWSVLFLVAVNLPVFIIGLVLQPVGPIVATVVSFIFTALLLTHEFLSFPLGRKLISYRRRWRMVWENKWLGMGFGTAAMLLFFVPGLNLVLLPLASVGGTLLYCDLLGDERIVVRDASEITADQSAS